MSVSRDYALERLSQAIPDEDPNKVMIIWMIEKMIPPDEIRSEIFELAKDKDVRFAYSMYRKFHPNEGNVTPELPQIMRWLLSRSATKELQDLYGRLDKIKNLLDGIGEVRPNDEVMVPTRIITQIRFLILQALS